MDLLRDLQSEIEQRGLTGAGKAVLRQNPILEISDHKSLLQLVGEFVIENVNPIRQYNLRALYKAHPAQAPAATTTYRRSLFLLSSDALVPMMQSADFPDLNDPAGL